MSFLDWVSRVWTLTIALGVSGGLLITLQSSSLLRGEEWLAKGERGAALSKSATKASVQAISVVPPLSFEANKGQSAGQVKFFSRGNGYDLFLTSTEIVLALPHTERRMPDAEGKNTHPSVLDRPAAIGTATVLRIKLAGANAAPQVIEFDELPGKSHYFLGNNPKAWKVNVPHYAKVKYEGIYPGIDLVFYGSGQQWEFDFVVAPGASPETIALSFGAVEEEMLKSSLRIDPNDDLIVQTASEELRFHKPRIYQELNGASQAIAGAYVFRPPSADEANGQNPRQIGFQIASYDTSKPLIIDPVLSYSTYIGGRGQAYARGITVDAVGNVYVAGQTASPNFSTTANAVQPQINYGPVQFRDAFVLKLKPEDNSLIYATYLGGTSSDEIRGIAVDAAGNAYVTGSTQSTDFPATQRFPSETANKTFPPEDAFVTKLSPAGDVLIYSIYLGGSSLDRGYGITVDASGSAYVTGSTISADFPLVNPLQAKYGGAFVTKLDPTGTALVYSTFLGHDLNDRGHSIAVDAAGNAYVTGPASHTLPAVLLSEQGKVSPFLNPEVKSQPTAPNFPLVNPVQGTYGGGGSDGFVAKINPAGTALVYSTYLGGSDSDAGNGIAVDAAGNAYVVGHSFSTLFPKNNSLPARRDGCSTVDRSHHINAFVMKLNPAGNVFVYTACLGDSAGTGIAIDAAGNAYVTGYTEDKNFPTIHPLQTVHRGSQFDVFVAKLNPAGSALDFATYLGGDSTDLAFGIAVDASRDIYVTGNTDSENFPLVNPLRKMNRGDDAFVAKISLK